MTMVSPRDAGLVDDTRLPLACVMAPAPKPFCATAAMPGEEAATGTVMVFDGVPLFMKTMVAVGPLIEYGTTAKTCVAVIVNSGAAVLLIINCAPPRLLGNGGGTALAGGRPVPWVG